MIDLHTHILPGIDDGVETEDEAVEFAKMAVADGTREIVATPHCKEGFYANDRGTVLAAVERLSARLRAEQVPLILHPGAEVHLCPDLVDRVKDGRAPTLADNGRTLLLELSLSQYPIELENLMFQLSLAGIQVLLAHPERIRYFQDGMERYEALVRLGAYGQITTGSITGLFGGEAQKFSLNLLRRGLVHVIASDAHNLRRRAPVLREALAAVVPIVGEQRAASMVEDVPRALLEGREPMIPEIEDEPARSRSFFSRLFRRG